MHAIILTIAIIVLCNSAGAATYDTGYGTFETPEEFTFEKTGTVDSFSGTLTRKADGFTVSFDIGGMSGTHMSPKKRDQCVFFRTHTVNGNFTWTGIERGGGKQVITTTIFHHGELSRRMSEEVTATNKLSAEQRQQKAREWNERWGQLPKDPVPPANFWADFTRDTDLADFLLIVSTYKPKAP